MDVHLTSKQLGIEKEYANAYVKIQDVDLTTIDVELYLGTQTSLTTGQDAFQSWGYGTWLQYCPIWIVATARKFNGVTGKFTGNGFQAPMKARVTLLKFPAEEQSTSEPSADVADYRSKEIDQSLRSMCSRFALDAKMLGL